MASPIDAKLILCDAAQADQTSGKMHMLGAGWTVSRSPITPHAVAVMLKVPWDRTNQKISVTLFLVTSDGAEVAPPSSGGKPLKIESEIEVGRPPGIAAGSHIPAAFAVNVPSLPLDPGRYEWRLVAGETEVSEPFQILKR